MLHAPQIAAAAEPGQFIELSTAGATLLNKPFSIARVTDDRSAFSIVYKVVGPGTRAIASFAEDRIVNLLGPCGKGFPRHEERAYLVGGGIGVPPLFFLASRRGNTRMTIMLGAGTRDDIVLMSDFENSLGVTPVIATDDGSAGHEGTVVELLEDALLRRPAPVYACGPMPMLAAVARLCGKCNVPSYVCLEAYMGCGMGVCMGCAVPTVRGMERVCREGPVFSGADILWDAVG